MHSFRPLILVILAVILCPLSGFLAHAADETRDFGSGCQNAITTAQMRICENARYEKAEQALNAVYARLMKELDAGQQTKLRNAQRAWLRFRAAEAAFQADTARGGTLAPLLKVSTQADMTEARASELSKALRQ